VAAGLGLDLEPFFDASPAPSAEDINSAFYQACSGGHRRTAEYLFARGASVNLVPSYAKDTPLAAAGKLDTGREALIGWLKERGATESAV
jgi:hypothetical protein